MGTFNSKIDEVEFYKNQLKIQNEKIQNLEKLMQKIKEENNKNIEKELDKEFTKQKLKNFVNNLLDDDDINIKYLPDFVEKELYINILTIIFGLIKHSLEEFNIKFLDYNIKVSVSSNESNIDLENKEKKIEKKVDESLNKEEIDNIISYDEILEY
jgi:hypothetical protein